jgi:hypothetical protein
VLLYREFVRETSPSVEVAVRAMLGGEGAPADPDYFTPWRPASVRVLGAADVVTVDLGHEALAAPGVDRDVARAAVQQLVYTVTAAATSLHDATSGAASRVRVLVDGAEGYLAWGQVRLGAQMTRDGAAVAPIWVIEPQNGARTSPGRVRVTGVGTAFEGVLRWEARAVSGRVVDEGVARAGSGAAREPFDFTISLPRGRYTITVYAPDASDGESPEGPRQYPDSKVVVVP